MNFLNISILVIGMMMPLSLHSQCVGTVAGNATGGFVNDTGLSAQFNFPEGVAADANGNLYVADRANNRIRKISPTGEVTTLAGSGTAGAIDGGGAQARFNNPYGVAVDASGNVYVADYGSHRIRKITPSGTVSTLAGNGLPLATDGTGSNASFNYPTDVAVDASGNVYVADRTNFRIRKITSAGVVTTLAGSTNGYTDGTGTAAKFGSPVGVAVDASGNVYVADRTNHRIRKITPAGVVTTVAGGGNWDPNCSCYPGGYTDANGTNARFNYPTGIEVDGSGNLYVTDKDNHRIRKISTTGDVTTLAGNSTPAFANGNGTSAQFSSPNNLVLDATGNLYVADQDNHRIRKITLTGTSGPSVPNITLCGAGSASFVARTALAADEVVEWSTDGTNWGNPGITSPAYSVASSASITRYARIRNTVLGCTSTSVSATATAGSGNGPSTPTVANQARCGSGLVYFTATNTLGANEVVEWSTDNTNWGNPGTTSPGYTVGSGASITRYARVRNTQAGCSSTGIGITATAVAAPAAPTVANETRCGDGTITFAATSTLGANEVVEWSTDGNSWGYAGTTSPAFTVAPGSPITRYARIRNTVADCSGSSTTVTGTANANPTTPTITQNGNQLQSSQTSGNQWLDAAQQPIAGATGQTYSPTTAGTYYLRYTDANSCSATSTAFSYVPTALATKANTVDFELYPNPGNGAFRVVLPQGGSYTLRIRSLAGAVLGTYSFEGDSYSCDSWPIAAGMYIVEVSSPNTYGQKRLIVR